MELPPFTGDEPCAQTSMDLWISDDDTNRIANVRMLRQVCSACPMKEPCLGYALRVKVVGFWGGMTDGERAKERKRLGIRAEPILKAI